MRIYRYVTLLHGSGIDLTEEVQLFVGCARGS